MFLTSAAGFAIAFFAAVAVISAAGFVTAIGVSVVHDAASVSAVSAIAAGRFDGRGRTRGRRVIYVASVTRIVRTPSSRIVIPCDLWTLAARLFLSRLSALGQGVWLLTAWL